MLVNMLWVSVAPLVYCGYISVDPEYLIVCCYGLDDSEGISIIHFWVPIAFNNYILVFNYYKFVICQR